MVFGGVMTKYSTDSKIVVLDGKKGLDAFVKILTSKPEKYDAETEAKKALMEMKKQGFSFK